MKHLSESILSKRTGMYNVMVPNNPELDNWVNFLIAKGFRKSYKKYKLPTINTFLDEEGLVFYKGRDPQLNDFLMFKTANGDRSLVIWDETDLNPIEFYMTCDKNGNLGRGYWKELDDYSQFVTIAKETFGWK